MPYNIPVNALLVVELRGLAKVLEANRLRQDLVGKARKIADRVESAIWKLGVVDREGWGEVFAYEIDGFGGRVFVCPLPPSPIPFSLFPIQPAC